MIFNGGLDIQILCDFGRGGGLCYPQQNKQLFSAGFKRKKPILVIYLSRRIGRVLQEVLRPRKRHRTQFLVVY